MTDRDAFMLPHKWDNIKDESINLQSAMNGEMFSRLFDYFALVAAEQNYIAPIDLSTVHTDILMEHFLHLNETERREMQHRIALHMPDAVPLDSRTTSAPAGAIDSASVDTEQEQHDTHDTPFDQTETYARCLWGTTDDEGDIGICRKEISGHASAHEDEYEPLWQHVLADHLPPGASAEGTDRGPTSHHLLKCFWVMAGEQCCGDSLIGLYQMEDHVKCHMRKIVLDVACVPIAFIGGKSG